MLHFCFIILALSLGEVSMRFHLSRLTKMTKPGLYMGVATAAALCSWTMANIWFPAAGGYLNVAGVVCGIVLTWYFAPDDMKWRSVLLSTLFFTAQILAVNTLVQSLLQNGFTPRQLLYPDSKLFPFVCLGASISCAVIFYGVTAVVRKIFEAPPQDKINFWMVVPLLLQLMFLIGVYFAYYRGGMELQFSFVYAAATITALCVSLAYAVIYRKYLVEQEKSWKLQQVEDQLQVQTMYFDQMQQNIQHVNQIRHDLNNQLQAAYYLLEKGNVDEVRHQLDALKASAANKVGPRFCPNLMVDAVLSEKAALCSRQQIPLEIMVELPTEIPVENTHLCSIFSNLLDNSIHAVQQLPQPGQPIRLSCGIRQGFLVIRCENPCKTQSRVKNSDPLREHGLGLAILQQLAEKYDGHMETCVQNGCFSASMMLNLRREEI